MFLNSAFQPKNLQIPFYQLYDNTIEIIRSIRKKNRTFLTITSRHFSTFNSQLKNYPAYQYSPSLYLWSMDMAKKFGGVEFVTISLNRTHEKKVHEFAKQQELTFDKFFDYCAEKGYKASFSFVDKDMAWCVSVTGKQEATYNASLCMTTWSDSLIEAVAMCFFKMRVLTDDGDWSEYSEDGRWG